jgi:TolB-like protein
MLPAHRRSIPYVEGVLVRTVVLVLTAAAALNAGSARAEDLAAASRRVADSLASVLAASPGRAAVSTVAVLRFAETGVVAGLGAQVSDLVAARLGQAARVKVLDGAALQAILGEQRLRTLLASGRPEDADLARAGAQAVVAGEVVTDGERLRIRARLLLPGGKLLGTAQAAADRGAPAPAAPVAAPAGGESGSVEIAVRRMADGLAGGFARLPGSTRYRRLAVLAFAEVGDRAQQRKLGTIVAAEVATVLRRDHGLLLVEREKIGQVLGELRLQQMVAPDTAQAGKIGQLADAQALVIGSVAEAGDRYLVTSRIVATQSGESLAAESASLPEAALVAVASDAVVLRSRGDAAFRSLLVPGLGQLYNRQPVKGWFFAGAAAGLAGAAIGFHLAGASAFDRYRKATSSAEATRLYEQASSRNTTRNWLLVGLAAAWAVNVVDAYTSGVDGQAMLGGGVAVAPLPGGAGLALAGRF